MWPGKTWGYRGTDDSEHLTRRYEELLAQVYLLSRMRWFDVSLRRSESLTRSEAEAGCDSGGIGSGSRWLGRPPATPKKTHVAICLCL